MTGACITLGIAGIIVIAAIASGWRERRDAARFAASRDTSFEREARKGSRDWDAVICKILDGEDWDG